MNILPEYNNEDEYLMMYPDLLPKDNIINTLSDTDKVDLKKSFPITLKGNQVSFTRNISFQQT